MATERGCPANRALLGLLAVVAALLTVGCTADNAEDDDSTPFDPASRAVTLETAKCEGSATAFGSGVAVGGGLAVTVAHLVVHARTIEASVAGSPMETVTVAAVDLERDLAVLRIPTDEIPETETTILDPGERGHIVGSAASGTVPFEVKRRVNLTIEDVLGTDRHARLGYEVAAVTTDGDSGAGAYDGENRLVGLVFAVGEDGATSWLTASSEIEDLLASIGPSDSFELCP